MKKTILLFSIIGLSACAYFDHGKKNEEVQYYGFNERSKASVKKEDIYISKITRIDSLNAEINDISSKYGKKTRLVGSWDFSSKPTKILKDEILTKAVELGSNYVIIFEKKDCANIIDIKRNEIEPLVGSYCYRVSYYYLPISPINNDDDSEPKATKSEAKASTEISTKSTNDTTNSKTTENPKTETAK